MADVLVLGGTAWLGRQVAAHAVALGHAVTCLARGRAGDPPDGVTLVRADRAEPGGYAAVTDTDCDLVIDVSSQPGHVRTAVAALGGRARHWVYVSSGSAYADSTHVTRPGDDPWADLAEPFAGDTWDDIEHYGAAKAACELACRDGVPEDRLLVARVGLIAGPGDGSDRVGYWPARFALAGDGPVLVPGAGDGEARAQFVDVRDLAAWLVDAGLAGRDGVVDAVGPSSPLSDVLKTAAEVAGFTGQMVAAAPAWLTEHDVNPWAGPRSLPLWLPEGYGALACQTEDAARAAGLAPRPLAETLRDVLEDERARGLERQRRSGLTRAEELALLEALTASP